MPSASLSLLGDPVLNRERPAEEHLRGHRPVLVQRGGAQQDCHRRLPGGEVRPRQTGGRAVWSGALACSGLQGEFCPGAQWLVSGGAGREECGPLPCCAWSLRDHGTQRGKCLVGLDGAGSQAHGLTSAPRPCLLFFLLETSLISRFFTHLWSCMSSLTLTSSRRYGECA